MPSKNNSINTNSDQIMAEPKNNINDDNRCLNGENNDDEVESGVSVSAPNIMRRMRRSSGYYTLRKVSRDSNQSTYSKPVSRSHSLSEQNNYLINDSAEQTISQENTCPFVCDTSSSLSKQKMQRKLKYYFMNPIEKWRAKKRFPFKLLIQIIKIVLVTYQLVLFGEEMSRYMNNEGNMIVSFRELFLTNWDPVREVMAYPPAAGPFAVYTKQDFYESVDYAIRQYSNISDLSIGTFGYAVNATHRNDSDSVERNERNMSDIILCRKRYSEGDADPSNYYYDYDNNIIDECIIIGEIYEPGDKRWFTEYQTLNYLNDHNFSLNFDRVLSVELMMPLRTIYLNSLAKFDSPKCYDVNITILYDNTQHDGQLLVSLNSKQFRHKCSGNLQISDDSDSNRLIRQIINWIVIVFCFLSFILCVRSLINGYKLSRETDLYFKNHFEISLTFQEKIDFIDFWYVMIIINDVIIFSGSIIQMFTENQLETVENNYYSTCSILLGIGNMLVWAGVLRYLGFFDKYNLLIVTLRRAIPHVLRFMLCTLILYGGFLLMGWVVLGPYHLKFRTISRTSECLFSLINGDDMFATFYITEYGERVIIWWFSRFYFYTFVCLFIYVVLSLFIAIIMDSYETIKEYYENGIPETNLQKFIAQCNDDSTSKAYMDDRNRTIADIFHLCLNCFRRTDDSVPYNTI